MLNPILRSRLATSLLPGDMQARLQPKEERIIDLAPNIDVCISGRDKDFSTGTLILDI